MSQQISSLPDAIRVVSSNAAKLTPGHNEPEVTNVKEALQPVEMFDGKLRRTLLAAGPVPAQANKPILLENPSASGIAFPGGSNAYFLDLAPGFATPMHRTVSTDFLLVQKGTATILTPKGPYSVVDGKADYTEVEETIVQEGQVLIQRGQMHALSNKTSEWLRFWIVVVDAEPQDFQQNGAHGLKTLGELWL